MRFMSIQLAMGPLQWLMLLTLSVLWGGSFFFIEIAIESVPPLTIVLSRVSLASLSLLALLHLKGVQLNTLPWRDFVGMAILNNVIPFTLITYGQTAVGSSLASILNATTPLFTIVLAHYLTGDEKLNACRLTGVVVGFIGVVVMIGGEALLGANTSIIAEVTILGAAASYALAGVFGRRFKERGVVPLAAAGGQVTVSTLLLIPVVLLVDRPWALSMPASDVMMALLLLGLLSTATAYLLYFSLLSRAGATNLLLVAFLIPVSASYLGITFLGETLSLAQITGMLLITTGLIFIDQRLPRCVALAIR